MRPYRMDAPRPGSMRQRHRILMLHSVRCRLCSNMPTETIRSNGPLDLPIILQGEAYALLQPRLLGVFPRDVQFARAIASCRRRRPAPSRPRKAQGRPTRSQCRAPAGPALIEAWLRCAASWPPALVPERSLGRRNRRRNTASRRRETAIVLMGEVIVMCHMAPGRASRSALTHSTQKCLQGANDRLPGTLPCSSWLRPRSSSKSQSVPRSMINAPST